MSISMTQSFGSGVIDGGLYKPQNWSLKVGFKRCKLAHSKSTKGVLCEQSDHQVRSSQKWRCPPPASLAHQLPRTCFDSGCLWWLSVTYISGPRPFLYPLWGWLLGDFWHQAYWWKDRLSSCNHSSRWICLAVERINQRAVADGPRLGTATSAFYSRYHFALADQSGWISKPTHWVGFFV